MVKCYVSICIFMMSFMTLAVFAEDYMQVDFDSELVGAGPAGWVQESGNWQVEDIIDNKVYKQVGATNSGAHSSYNLPTAQSDLAADFTFNRNQLSTSGYAVWLADRWTDNNNFVRVGYNASAWKIRQKIAGLYSEKASLTEITDGWQYVWVIAQGGVLALYVDQELKVLTSDITHTSAGNIALYSHHAKTYFDNLHAYTLIHADYFDDDTVSSNPSGWAEEVGNWQVSSISSNHVYHKVAAEAGAGAYSSYDVNEDGLIIEWMK